MSAENETLNLFYEEPDPDRWIRFDRYPRRIVRRLVRGRPRPRGQTRVFLNLCAGLDRIGVHYRVNDYRHASKHPEELACIVGRPFVLDKVKWKNPIVFGAAVYSHPLDDPNLLARLPVKKILVPGPWMKAMCQPYWGDAVESWPVGIDTVFWSPPKGNSQSIDVLLYDKVLWNRNQSEANLLQPIRDALRTSGRSVVEFRYGYYKEEDFRDALARCRAMIFLCEHETQGLAYQQALACGVPILAWDQGGAWKDPAYYPDRVVFEPVTSVPYWDERCGERFACAGAFPEAWTRFWQGVQGRRFDPRAYVLEHLTLEHCAREYLKITRRVLDQRD